ncbi:MAG: diguanylate cyclase, partial [Veillonella sp.]|nr:diguanylate cyclase [Veillonella sp.]
VIYTAVRDENGKFRGVLEMMQDCTHIRELEGSRTLLTWDKTDFVGDNQRIY